MLMLLHNARRPGRPAGVGGAGAGAARRAGVHGQHRVQMGGGSRMGAEASRSAEESSRSFSSSLILGSLAANSGST